MLSIAPDKCTITYFTPDKARQSKTHPQFLIKGRPISLDKTPRILGVRFDTHFSFNAHVMDIVKTIRSKTRILSSLAGTGWGCDKETLLRTYKVYVEPSLNYAAAIWSPNISDTSFEHLQRLQNRALRIATGCHSNTQISHLHHEAKVALVKDHLELLSTQLLLSCSRPSHPSHDVIRQPQGARSMKHTLQSKHGDKIARFVNDGAIDSAVYKKILDELHTEAVKKTIAKLDPNPLLGAPTPPVSPSEATLTRKQRTTMAQLRGLVSAIS